MLIDSFILTEHALAEMTKRNIPLETVTEVLRGPEQIVEERWGRNCYQSRIVFPNGGTYLVRIIVDFSDIPPTVRTVYRTSKVMKYWRLQ